MHFREVEADVVFHESCMHIMETDLLIRSTAVLISLKLHSLANGK